MNTRTKQPQNTEPAPYSVRSTNGLLLWLSGVHFEGHGDFYGLDSALAISTGKADIEAARVVFDHVLLNLQWVIQHPTRRPANIYYKTEDDRFVHAPDPETSWSLRRGTLRVSRASRRHTPHAHGATNTTHASRHRRSRKPPSKAPFTAKSAAFTRRLLTGVVALCAVKRSGRRPQKSSRASAALRRNHSNAEDTYERKVLARCRKRHVLCAAPCCAMGTRRDCHTRSPYERHP